MVKKLIILISLFLFINVIILFPKKETVKQVFLENDSAFKNDSNIYNLDIESLTVTSKTLSYYFSKEGIKVLGLYPQLNKLYKHKLFGVNNYYSFKRKTLLQSIREFENHFQKVLQNYGLKGEIEKVRLEGILIKKVKVYASLEEINNLLKAHPKIKVR